MSKPRICKSCHWLHNRAEPCCSCSRWGKGKTDHYIPAEETLEEYLERKGREDMDKTNMSTEQLLDAMLHCVISGDCTIYHYWNDKTGCSFEDEEVDLMREAYKHLERLQQELIDERDRYDRLVSFELEEAELLRAAKDMLGACAYKVFFGDAENAKPADCTSSTADKGTEGNERSVEGDAPYNGNICTTNEIAGMAAARMEAAKANGITYAEQLQRERENTSSTADAVPLPLKGKANEGWAEVVATSSAADERDDTVRRCAEYIAEKNLQLDEEPNMEYMRTITGEIICAKRDDISEPPESGRYWRKICGINAKQDAKGRAKYGQSLEENTTLSTVQRIEHAQEELIDALKYLEHLKAVATDKLTANDYQRMAMRTAGEYDTVYDQLRNAAYGLNGEAGEVIDLLKKHEFQGHDLSDEKLIDECGDVLWYCALLADALGFSLEQVMNRNIDKLRKRYPDGFDKARSINRGEDNAGA